MNDKLDFASDEIVQGLLQTIEDHYYAEFAADGEVSPIDMAHITISKLLIFLAGENNEDSLLFMVKKVGEAWRTHLHYDYLSADHDHFKEDFDWGVPEVPNG